MTTLQLSVNKALEKIGTSNGTAPPKTQDLLDLAAHQFGVAAIGSSFFEKEKKNAREDLLEALGPAGRAKMEKVKKRVSDNAIKEDVQLGGGEYFEVMAEIKVGASYIDTDALRVELMRRMKTEEVDVLFKKVTKRREPSVSFKILDNNTE